MTPHDLSAPCLLRTLTPATWKPVHSYLQEGRADWSTPETARCARGRENFWLPWEPIYRDGTYIKARSDARLWAFIRRLVPRADLAQVFYGNKAIDWHRDAAYAHRQAWLLSLGHSTFELRGRDGRLHGIRLQPGQLLTFDCKCEHRAAQVDPDRIGIGIWRAKIPLPAA